MSGDSIKDLPINKERSSTPGDLEIIYNLFQPKNIPVMKQVMSPFKTAALGSILFGIFSLPFISKLIDTFVKNPVYSKLILLVVFFIVFFIVQKMFKL